jgi:hypothetical protein
MSRHVPSLSVCREIIRNVGPIEETSRRYYREGWIENAF